MLNKWPGRRKQTCQFCTHFQDRKCSKHNCTVEPTKRRICGLFEASLLVERQEKIRIENGKIKRDGSEYVKKEPFVWEQTDKFYDKIWEEHQQRMTRAQKKEDVKALKDETEGPILVDVAKELQPENLYRKRVIK